MLLRHVIPRDFPPRFSQPAPPPPAPPASPSSPLSHKVPGPSSGCLLGALPALLSSPSRPPFPVRAELALLLFFMSTCSSACTSVRRLHLQQHADGSPLLHKGTTSLLCALPHPRHLQPCTPAHPHSPHSPRIPPHPLTPSPQPSSTLLRSGKYLQVSQQVHMPSSQEISSSAPSGAPGALLSPWTPPPPKCSQATRPLALTGTLFPVDKQESCFLQAPGAAVPMGLPVSLVRSPVLAARSRVPFPGSMSPQSNSPAPSEG